MMGHVHCIFFFSAGSRIRALTVTSEIPMVKRAELHASKHVAALN
jgi:hypothetical protein